MKKRCKNCVHRSWTIEGDTYCVKHHNYTNDDGCCSEFKKDAMTVVSIVLSCLAVVAFILFLLKLVANG